MTYLTKLLAGGECYEVKLSNGTASLKPKNDSDALDAFQHIADEIALHDGEGYSIELTHQTRDRPGDLIDVILLRL